MLIAVLEKEEIFIKHFEKLLEEVGELHEEVGINTYVNKEKAISEALDVIQVCIGLIDKLEPNNAGIEKAVNAHFEKLKGRGWKFKKLIELRIEGD